MKHCLRVVIDLDARHHGAGVDAGAQLEPLTGPVLDPHHGGAALSNTGSTVCRSLAHQEVQCHGGNLRSVLVSILLGDPGGHHVGVIDRVHLQTSKCKRPDWSNLTNPSQSEALFITTRPRYHHEISHLEDVILAQATVKHLVEGVEECHHLNRKQVKILKVMMLITSAGELSSTVWMKSTRSLKYMVTESNLTAFILLRC